MTENRSDVPNLEVESWLKPIFSKLKIANYSLEVQGTSEKGDGYMSDIFFLEVTEKTLDGNEGRKFNWVVKCGKRSEKLRQTVPVREVFRTEIQIYDHVLPEIVKFQKSKKVEDYFKSFPKCYGTVLLENMEVVVLENMKKLGYDLWDRIKPLPRTHLEMILTEYGKFHATSLALQDQRLDKFKELVDSMVNIHDVFAAWGITNFFANGIDGSYPVIKDSLDTETLEKWLKLKTFIPEFGMKSDGDYGNDVKVVLHGDCWNNNFLFKFKDNINFPTDVSFLDWQNSEIGSPVYDLAYFLYACVSKEDLEKFDELLKVYYDSFATHLKNLGSDPDKLYSLEQLKSDWKKYSKYGLVMTNCVLNIVLSQGDEIADIAENAENGLTFEEICKKTVKDGTLLRDRLVPIIEHAAKHNFI